MILFLIYIRSEPSYDQITKRFQEKIIRIEEYNYKTLISLKDSLKTNKLEQIDFDRFFSQFPKDANSSFYIFYHDSLIYWSDNKVNVSALYFSQTQDGDFKYLSNGSFDILKSEFESYRIGCLIRIKNQYAYENLYLSNKIVKPYFHQAIQTISPEQGKYNILNREGNFLFSIKFHNTIKLTGSQNSIFIIVFFLIFISLLLLIFNLYNYLLLKFNLKNLLLCGFVLDVIITRGLFFYFRFPNELYQTALFSPELFSASQLIPSLGDLLLHSISLLVIALAINRLTISQKQVFKKIKAYYILFPVIVIFASLVLFQNLIILLQSIVIDSNIPLNLSDLGKLNRFCFVSLLCYGLLNFSFVLISRKALLLATGSDKYRIFIILITFLILLICNYFLPDFKPVILIYSAIFLLFVYTIIKFGTLYKQKFGFSETSILILLFSILSTVVLNNSNDLSEKENRKILAQNLTQTNDPLTEIMLSETFDKLRNDPEIDSVLIKEFPYEDWNYKQLEDFISRKYFRNFWNKYNVLITLCDSSDFLNLTGENISVNCHTFFNETINRYGLATATENLYYVDRDLDVDNYLGAVLINPTGRQVMAYIELYSKQNPQGLGYPELLVDFKEKNQINWALYSYARYENNDLYFRLGKYYYPMSLKDNMPAVSTPTFIDINGFSHYFLPMDDKKTVIVSKKNPGFLDLIAPFSYITILYVILALTFALLSIKPSRLIIQQLGFKRRLQVTITFLIISSFIIIGTVSVLFIIQQNKNKNISILSEKAHSVLIELEHKLSFMTDLPVSMDGYLHELLIKFSNVFFSDINLFSPQGSIIASSRVEVFNHELISVNMDPFAFKNLTKEKKSLFIQEESIGNYKFLSAYLPLINTDNQLIAYINLPYFAKQEELTNEISSFLVAFINIYVLLIGISVYLALFIANYITKPIQLLKEKLGTLKLGVKNQKIEWNKTDEIGELVAEYNRMVNELAHSAERLAKSERESAWREMAKQIAHEIKNPLTPMKLNIQYLQKAWDEKLPGWEKQLQRITQSLIDQIDSLSVISSAFSDFANMPKSNFTKINVAEIARRAIDLFKDTTQIQFILQTEEEPLTLCDKDQLLRVFNNLIKNSIQAIACPEQGKIEVSITTNQGVLGIFFKDNGVGIPLESQVKVFYPNFTTKSGGTGMGLALVKNIIKNCGGSIYFESSPGVGTSFIIELPVYSENNANLSDSATSE